MFRGYVQYYVTFLFNGCRSYLINPSPSQPSSPRGGASPPKKNRADKAEGDSEGVDRGHSRGWGEVVMEEGGRLIEEGKCYN